VGRAKGEVDTSGSMVEPGGEPLEVMRDGITEFIQKNEAIFGENVRIGLVSWDEDIDETVNLTADYDGIKKACGNFSGNLQEFTLYQLGLNGSIEVFNRSPRENVKRVIVFVTDAKGTFDGFCNHSKLPDTSAYVIHAITIGPTQNEEIFNMLDNFTSQYNGTAVRVNESSEELEKALTTLTVSGIERRTLRNVTVVETLPKYMRALNGSYKKPPTSEHINSDGMEWNTVTMKWDIGDWSSDECWENTFKVLFCCRVPADVTQPEGISRVTSEVTYTDPTNNTITKHLPIPEGGLWIESQVPGFEALFAIAGLLAVGYIMWRRKR
jgi:PGF-CTERM protein